MAGSNKAAQHLSKSGLRKAFIWATEAIALELIDTGHSGLAGKLRNATLHWLRHTGGSHLIQGGTPITVAKDWFRHSNIATTMIYTHNETREKRNLFAKHVLPSKPDDAE